MIPNPGSLEARDLGCTCPVIDNGRGLGIQIESGQTVFVFRLDCPLHREGDWQDRNDEEAAKP